MILLGTMCVNMNEINGDHEDATKCALPHKFPEWADSMRYDARRVFVSYLWAFHAFKKHKWSESNDKILKYYDGLFQYNYNICFKIFITI